MVPEEKSMLSKVIKSKEAKNLEYKKFLCDEIKSIEEKNFNKENTKMEKETSINREEIETALKEANKKLKEAEEIYKKRYEEGFKKGYDDGILKAKQDTEKEVESMRKELLESIKKIESSKNEIISELQNSSFLIIKEALKKVVASELKLNDEAILNIVKDAVMKISQAKKLTIKLNPEDYNYIEGKIEEIKINPESEIKIVPDSSITKGGCIVSTEMGEVDATVETKIEEILKVIQE